MKKILKIVVFMLFIMVVSVNISARTNYACVYYCVDGCNYLFPHNVVLFDDCVRNCREWCEQPILLENN